MLTIQYSQDRVSARTRIIVKCVEMNKDQRGREWLRLNAEVGIEPALNVEDDYPAHEAPLSQYLRSRRIYGWGAAPILSTMAGR